MPALGGVQMMGGNGQLSNSLILPSGGISNFVPDPSTLVSTNYFTLPAPGGLPAMGPGTTNFPGIYLNNGYNGGASAYAPAGPASGEDPGWASITKPMVNFKIGFLSHSLIGTKKQRKTNDVR